MIWSRIDNFLYFCELMVKSINERAQNCSSKVMD